MATIKDILKEAHLTDILFKGQWRITDFIMKSRPIEWVYDEAKRQMARLLADHILKNMGSEVTSNDLPDFRQYELEFLVLKKKELDVLLVAAVVLLTQEQINDIKAGNKALFKDFQQTTNQQFKSLVWDMRQLQHKLVQPDISRLDYKETSEKIKTVGQEIDLLITKIS